MPDPFGYAGKRCVVTGCAAGIGREVARLLDEAGAEVHGLDRAAADLPLAAFTRVDLSRRDEIEAAAAALGPRVDALFNCAGLAPTRPRLEVLTVNFIAVRHLTGLVLARMGEGGAVVGVGSNGGAGWRENLPLLRGLLATAGFDEAVRWCERELPPATRAYNFAKEALAAWTMRESAATIARGVRLNCASPGAVQTAMLDEIAGVVPVAAIDAVTRPIGRRSSPLEQAWPLLFLGSGLASYVNGADLPVDGGFVAAQALAG